MGLGEQIVMTQVSDCRSNHHCYTKHPQITPSQPSHILPRDYLSFGMFFKQELLFFFFFWSLHIHLLFAVSNTFQSLNKWATTCALNLHSLPPLPPPCVTIDFYLTWLCVPCWHTQPFHISQWQTSRQTHWGRCTSCFPGATNGSGKTRLSSFLFPIFFRQ